MSAVPAYPCAHCGTPLIALGPLGGGCEVCQIPWVTDHDTILRIVLGLAEVEYRRPRPPSEG